VTWTLPVGVLHEISKLVSAVVLATTITVRGFPVTLHSGLSSESRMV
jgi:hypothetical protein